MGETDVVAKTNEDRRAETRFNLDLQVAVRERGRSDRSVTLTSLSRGGCSIAGAALFFANQDIWVKIPGLESLSAELRWTSDGRAGATFQRPLHPAVLSSYVPEPLPDHAFTQTNAEPIQARDIGASRKEQILSGWAEPAQRILARKHPQTNGSEMSGLIRRRTSRVADHRLESRYAAPANGNSRLQVGSQDAKLLNLSASGLQVELDCEVEIGSSLAVCFEGFDDLAGHVIWVRNGQVGLSLPRESIELSELAETV